MFPREAAHVTVTLRKMAAGIETKSAPSKDQLWWLKLSKFGDKANENGYLRHNENLLELEGVELDYDSKEIPIEDAVEVLEKGNVAALVYTSPSNLPGEHKWRILAPTSEPLEQIQRDLLLGRIAGLFFIKYGKDIFDPASWTPSQSYYYGYVEGNKANHEVFLVDGEPIDALHEFDSIWRTKPLRIAKFAESGHDAAYRSHANETELDLEAVYNAVASGKNFHNALLSLAAHLFGKGYDREGVFAALIEAMERVPEEHRDHRWRLRSSRRHIESILNWVSTKENRKLFKIREERKAREEDARTEEPAPPPKDGKEEKKPTVTNTMALRRAMARDGRMNGIVGLDEFACRPVLLKPIYDPDRGPPNDFQPRPWEDTDDTQLAIYFQSIGYLKASSAMANEVMRIVAKENRFHPVRDYLDGLRWDRGPRLMYLMQRGFGAKAGRASYLASVGRSWLIAAVARIYSPGCKVDTMPILEGPQGVLKSSGVRALCPDENWFSDTLPNDLAHKDAQQHLPGNWLVEMSEISQLRKAEVETLKGFLTVQVDKFRPSYGRAEVSRPRQCVFVGTTNEDQYLTDVTGNRRFWPVMVGRVNLDWIKENRDQLWAEAREAYRAGEKWWLDGADAEAAVEEQESRTASDVWEVAIAHYVDGKERVTVPEILRSALDFESVSDHGSREANRVIAVLKKLGWVCHRSRVDGIVLRYWQLGVTPP